LSTFEARGKMEKQISDLVRMGETIQARIKRFGPQTALSITRAVLALNENEVNQVQAELERLAEQLGIVEGINGWVLDIGALILRMKDDIHAAIIRTGPQTTLNITVAILGLAKSDAKQVQANLERLADQLGIAQGEKGWVPDTSILAPEANRRYTLESRRIQVARQVAFDMGLEGKPEVAWRALSRRVTELTGEKIHEAWFAPSGRGSHFREHIEASFADGVAEREKRIDAVASELSDIVEEVTSATNGNGNGHHLEDDEPTEEDLTLIQEIAKLEADVEEYQNKIAALEAQLAASAPAQVQTPQLDTGGTLEGILAALETQLEAANMKADSAAKAVESAQEQAELAELEVDQARQRLQAALEAVQTLQSLKEGE
jgi:hypothetical protein